MPPIVVNGDPTIRKIRLDAYEYRQLRARRDKLALHCPEGGEVHMPNGSIVPVPADGWIIEQPDGTVQVLAGDLVLAEYEIVGEIAPGEGLEDADAAAAEVEEARHPATVENPPDEAPPVEEVQADAPGAPGVPQIPGANRDFQQTDPETGEPLTPQRKAELAAGFRQRAEQAAAVLAEAAGKAQAAGLITEHEAAAWRLTGEPPAGVTAAVSGDGQVVVSRAPVDASGSVTGDETAVDEGTPVVDIPTAQLDPENPDHAEELQERADAGDAEAQAVVNPPESPDAPAPDAEEGAPLTDGEVNPAQDVAPAPAQEPTPPAVTPTVEESPSTTAEPDGLPASADGSQDEGAPPA